MIKALSSRALPETPSMARTCCKRPFGRAFRPGIERRPRDQDPVRPQGVGDEAGLVNILHLQLGQDPERLRPVVALAPQSSFPMSSAVRTFPAETSFPSTTSPGVDITP